MWYTWVYQEPWQVLRIWYAVEEGVRAKEGLAEVVAKQIYEDTTTLGSYVHIIRARVYRPSGVVCCRISPLLRAVYIAAAATCYVHTLHAGIVRALQYGRHYVVHTRYLVRPYCQRGTHRMKPVSYTHLTLPTILRV